MKLVLALLFALTTTLTIAGNQNSPTSTFKYHGQKVVTKTLRYSSKKTIQSEQEVMSTCSKKIPYTEQVCKSSNLTTVCRIINGRKICRTRPGHQICENITKFKIHNYSCTKIESIESNIEQRIVSQVKINFPSNISNPDFNITVTLLPSGKLSIEAEQNNGSKYVLSAKKSKNIIMETEGLIKLRHTINIYSYDMKKMEKVISSARTLSCRDGSLKMMTAKSTLAKILKPVILTLEYTSKDLVVEDKPQSNDIKVLNIYNKSIIDVPMSSLDENLYRISVQLSFNTKGSIINKNQESITKTLTSVMYID